MWMCTCSCLGSTRLPASPNTTDTNKQVVDILKKAGADETVKDKEGHTAADYGYKKPGDGLEGKPEVLTAGKGGEL